jgi:DNA-directed RNA polymerase specialized sigma24 family protein
MADRDEKELLTAANINRRGLLRSRPIRPQPASRGRVLGDFARAFEELP